MRSPVASCTAATRAIAPPTRPQTAAAQIEARRACRNLGPPASGWVLKSAANGRIVTQAGSAIAMTAEVSTPSRYPVPANGLGKA